jgi:hypothetical protein
VDVTFSFKIWDQGTSGDPMAIRVAGVAELRRLAKTLVGPDAGSNWSSLAGYLADSAKSASPPIPFVRMVDVLWESTNPTTPTPYCQDRVFRVTYTGWQRKAGGFASQGYCYLDPAWATVLRPFHRIAIRVDVYPGNGRDLLVVRP